MNPQIVSRTLTQLSSVIQNVLAQLPESKRHQIADAICSSIKEGTPLKAAVDKILDGPDDLLSQAKLPPA